MKKQYLLPAVLYLGLGLSGCSSNNSESETQTTTAAPSTSEMAVGTDKQPTAMLQAVEMTSGQIPGYKFPEDSSTINGWIERRDAASIDRHGWGIWTTLSAPAGQGPDMPRVYETWPTADEVQQQQEPGTEQSPTMLLKRPRPVRRLRMPRQFLRDPNLVSRRPARADLAQAHAMTGSSTQNAFESVAYNPAAATFIAQNKLFLTATLQGMLNGHKGEIPELPRESIAIKPVYEIVPAAPSAAAPLYEMKVWTGTTDKQIPYGQAAWASTIYVDIKNQGQGNGAVAAAGAKPTPATTYNLRDFVYYRLTQEEADALNAEIKDTSNHYNQVPVNKGDYAILVAMHITTKEIKRWTWQTMWWAPNSANAPLPSSSAIAAHRPAQLTGAPRHYAMSIAYQMLAPVQPYAGGKSVGQSIYAFNPYLEAGFSPQTFSNNKHFQEPSRVLTKGLWVTNNVGVRTNCMSCHAQASFTSVEGPNPRLPLGYLGNTYVDMGSPKFKGRLRTDFLWSIADRATP
ncbi:hypothetical protein [Hymenobacter negativus]|uniref:Cytochrome c domain-containing protein n=1 Tax=Hymenobacter negativus TaxID=2795026 RepID=A0ABS0QBY6_9BACT|nr:hypothetical protein [Hymenobacter negativus]MBH8560206.1 hypothetical protein [Hymenobacter negativus]